MKVDTADRYQPAVTQEWHKKKAASKTSTKTLQQQLAKNLYYCRTRQVVRHSRGVWVGLVGPGAYLVRVELVGQGTYVLGLGGACQVTGT